MITQEQIRSQISNLYRTSPTVHMEITLKNTRPPIPSGEMKIVGVYPHIFQVEEAAGGPPRRHSLQYSDVLVGHVVISELNLHTP